MAKIKISLITMGHLPADFDKEKIKKWKSSLFEVSDDIESFALTCNSDTSDWGFSDDLLQSQLPKQFNGEFLVALVNVPLEQNYYCRRFQSNKLVFTFHEIKEILQFSNIPLENIVYRILYAHLILYKRCGNRIPETKDTFRYTHDETRGCLFDMNGLKTDVVHSCHMPIICAECIGKLRAEKVSEETIQNCIREIHRIRKDTFYVISDFIKRHPIWSLLISAITAIALGVIASLIATAISR